MTQNPFEAPRVHEAHLQMSTANGRFDIGQTVSDAWSAVTSELGLVIGVTLVGLLVATAGSFTVIGIFVLLPVLAWGGVQFVLNLHDKNAEFNDLFSGFKSYGSSLGGMLMLMLVSFLLVLPGYAVSIGGALAESAALSILGNLLTMAIAFGVMFRFYFAAFFMVDRGMGAIDALKASWEATADQKLATFGLALLAGLIGALGYLACGVGALVSLPMSYVMFASAYRQMTGSPAR